MYRHTQVGSFTIGLLLLTAAGTAAVFAFLHLSGVVWLGFGAVLAVALLFGSLTTEVDHQHFRFWFGPGLIRRTVPLSDIRSCRAVTNPWWYGWGIHRTPHGWLYNVSGLEAVELELQDGRRLRVGSDEPEELCRWIMTRRGT